MSAARHMLMTLIRASSRKSLPQIGRLFVGRNGDAFDHTSVLHGLRRFDKAVQLFSSNQGDPAFSREQVEAVVAVSTINAARRFLAARSDLPTQDLG